MTQNAKQFWDWFKEHSAPYLFLNEMDESKRSDMLVNLLDHLHWYCERLGYEIGGDDDKEQELIITAEGNTDYFDEVEILIATAPSMPGWTFTGFIPPRGEDFELSFEDVVLKPNDVYFIPMRDLARPDSIAIKVCLAGYDRIKDEEWLRPAIYKVLENILGEKSFAMDLQYIDISALPDPQSPVGIIEVSRLQEYITLRKAMQADKSHLN